MFGRVIVFVCLTSVLATDEAFEARTNERFDDLEAIIRGFAERNFELEERLEHLETENEDLRRHCGLAGTGDRLTDRRDVGVGENIDKRQLVTSTVAFTAILTPFTVQNLQNGDVVKFDKVITNVANAYESTTGIFTAPVGGVYVFNYALMVEPNTREYLQIVRDGQHIINNFAHSTSVSIYSSSSRTVTLELQQGSRVWIQTPPDFDHGDGSIHGNEYTTFSGWLVAITE